MIPAGSQALPPSPAEPLRARLLAHADALERAGADAAAHEVREAVDEWFTAHQAWVGELGAALALHHEINNALVGVRGNAQLLLMGPAGQQPAVRERLEVVMRESGRIQAAAVRMQELKAALAAGRIHRAA